MKILIGTDPELFVRDKIRNAFVSGHGMVAGTKEAPVPVKDGAIQVDGMALEFNTNPASTMEEFVKNINSVRSQLHAAIGIDTYDLVATPAVMFSKEVWDATPEEAKILGCEPDYNAYTQGENPAPDGNQRMRTGAGHVHVGWGSGFDVHSEDHVADCCEVVKHLDATLGLASLSWDQDAQRRSLYGKAGALRVKNYGVEYRVLSNAWLASQELVEFVYKTTEHAMKLLFEGVNLSNPEYTGVINNSDYKKAKVQYQELKEQFNLPALPA